MPSDNQNADLGNADLGNANFAGGMLPQTTVGLATDPLLVYVATFQNPHAVSIGSNGPWEWTFSNDQNAPFLPTAATVTITRPDGTSSGQVALLIDSSVSASTHRLGTYYTLDVAGNYTLYISVTIPDSSAMSTIVTQTELLVAG